MQKQHIGNINKLLNTKLTSKLHRLNFYYRIDVLCTCRKHKISEIYIDYIAIEHAADLFNITKTIHSNDGILNISHMPPQHSLGANFTNLYDKYPCFNENTIKLLMYEFEQIVELMKNENNH